MAILAAAIIPIKVNKDSTIDIIRQEISRCGCVSAGSLAIQTDKPADEIREIMEILAGNREVYCSGDGTVCCADKEKLQEFSERLQKLRGARG